MNTLLEYTDSKQNYSFDDFLVKKIPQEVGRGFVKERHYTGGCGTAAMTWGLYSNNSSELLGVIAFQTPISENVRACIFGDEYKDSVTELHRMAIADRAPHNTGSWFISRALDGLKEYKPQYHAVVAYADSTEGHDGTVYQAANADYYGTTGEVIQYRKPDGQLKAKRQVGENISPNEARERGWTVEQREQKHRYVFWLPDEYQAKEELRQRAEIKLQQYPSPQAVEK